MIAEMVPSCNSILAALVVASSLLGGCSVSKAQGEKTSVSFVYFGLGFLHVRDVEAEFETKGDGDAVDCKKK